MRLLELTGDRAINVAERNNKGETGLDLAEEGGHSEVVLAIENSATKPCQSEIIY